MLTHKFDPLSPLLLLSSLASIYAPIPCENSVILNHTVATDNVSSKLMKKINSSFLWKISKHIHCNHHKINIAEEIKILEE